MYHLMSQQRGQLFLWDIFEPAVEIYSVAVGDDTVAMDVIAKPYADIGEFFRSHKVIAYKGISCRRDSRIVEGIDRCKLTYRTYILKGDVMGQTAAQPSQILDQCWDVRHSEVDAGLSAHGPLSLAGVITCGIAVPDSELDARALVATLLFARQCRMAR
jgi:hypothetical protein